MAFALADCTRAQYIFGHNLETCTTSLYVIKSIPYNYLFHNKYIQFLNSGIVHYKLYILQKIGFPNNH